MKTKILLLRGTVVGGKTYEAGEIVEVTRDEAAVLKAIGKAEIIVNEPLIEQVKQDTQYTPIINRIIESDKIKKRRMRKK